MLEFIMGHKDILLVPFNMAGMLLNLYEKRLCFMVWWPTNLLFTYYAVTREVYGLAIMQAIYAVFNAWGVWKWRHKPWIGKEIKNDRA